MRYIVSGIVTLDVTVEVESDSKDEAIEMAQYVSSRDRDIWDSRVDFFYAEQS